LKEYLEEFNNLIKAKQLDKVGASTIFEIDEKSPLNFEGI
jgi:hypothetical protein